jgi:hypothetical protein
MYEVLLRTETLLAPLEPAVLLGIGAVALVVGLILWLAGTRYSTIITALLGAFVGCCAGLLIGDHFELQPLLSMLVGAVVLAVLAILLKKILVLILAVLVISIVGGAGYLSFILDRTTPPQPTVQQGIVYQSFTAMDPNERQAYIDELGGQSGTFADRLEAMLSNTWGAIRPHGGMALVAIGAGAVVALILVWFVSKVLVALAYSVIGVAAVFLGVQAALLAVHVPIVSQLGPRGQYLPIVFLALALFGWIWQLLSSRLHPARAKATPKEESEIPEQR